MADASRLALTLRAAVGRERGDVALLALGVDVLLAMARRFPGHHFEASAARCLLELGREGEARAELARALPSLLAGSGYRWLAAACDAAVVAAAVGTEDDCHRLLAVLDGYGADFAVLGPAFWGSVHTYAGALTARLGRHDEALARYDRAVDDLDRIGALSWAANARADRAVVHRRLGAIEQAEADDRWARDTAVALGMTRLLARLGGELGEETSAGITWSLERHDGGWRLEAGAERAVLPATRGMAHLQVLLANPRRDVPALALESGGAASVGPVGQEALDSEARAAYRARLAELDAAMEEADRRGDRERAEAAEEERAALVAELQRATGLGGRPRRTSDAAERARVNVTRNLRRAIDQVTAAAPQAGLHLASSVRTGTSCRYDPAPGGPDTWRT
jgi:hypothetical protein